MAGNCDLRETKAAIVAVGSFNPLIFQPQWLAANGLIGDHEAAAAAEGRGVEIIHREAVVLEFQRMKLQVVPDRFSLEITEPPLVSAKDFVEKCFGLLSHTPIVQAGVNFETVFRARSRQDWDAFGDTLAPKAPWRELFGEERTGGLSQLTMERGPRLDGVPGKTVVFVRVVEPRTNMDTSVLVNNHVEFGAGGSAANLVQHLQDHFDSDERISAGIAASLQELVRAV